MNIATLLFCFESELADYLDADRGAADDPIRLELESLPGHADAVSDLDGLDDWLGADLPRVGLSSAGNPFDDSDGDEWDQQD